MHAIVLLMALVAADPLDLTVFGSRSQTELDLQVFGAHSQPIDLTAFAAAEDARPVVEMRVPTFACWICDWWTQRGDAGLPFRIKRVVDDEIGDRRLPDGRKYGWPVFVITRASGAKVYVPRVGTNTDGLIQRFEQFR